MSYSYSAECLLMALALAASCHSHAATTSVHPDETEKALYALLGITNDFIPDSSSCQGYYHPGKAVVKDILAPELAGLYSGENIIQGHCKSGQCAISITHAKGESVTSTDIKFKLVNGKASIDSLECIITP